MSVCRRCSRTLTADEIAVYKRMVNRGADTFLCAACLAAEFHVPESPHHRFHTDETFVCRTTKKRPYRFVLTGTGAF